MTEFESEMLDLASELVRDFGADCQVMTHVSTKDPAQPWITASTPQTRTVPMAKTQESIIHKDGEKLPSGKTYAIILAESAVKVGDQVTDALGKIWSVETVDTIAPGATVIAYEVVLKK